MAGKIKVTEDVYKSVKILLTNGATQADIKKFYNLGHDMCSRINKSENYAEFNRIRKEAREKIRQYKLEKKNPQKQEIVLDKTTSKAIDAKDFYMINKLLKSVEEQTELLKQIGTKLAFIVEQLS